MSHAPVSENTSLTAIDGVLVGHCTRSEARTGCTAIVCPQGFTPGVSVPGFATGARETELLRPEGLVDTVHGLVLSGGSAFGLAAADGVVHFLRERGYGFVMPHGCVPIVSGAVLYDLDNNRRAGQWPDADMGYEAARAATDAPVEQGRVGAAAGALCGRLYALGTEASAACCDAGGLGSALRRWGGVRVAALTAVNALGNIYDPCTRRFVAGGRDAAGKPFSAEDTLRALARTGGGANGDALCQPMRQLGGNTVLTVVATNVPLNKVQATRLARMACAGLARAIDPCHMTLDGDIVFALAAKHPLPAEVVWTEDVLGALAAEAVSAAVCAAVSASAGTREGETV